MCPSNDSPPVSSNLSTKSRRVFFALHPSPAVRDRLVDLSSRLQKAAHFTPVRANWVPACNLHLTLHFLGSVPEEKIQRMLAELPAAASQISAFPLEVETLGYFPHAKAPRVLWAGIRQPHKELFQLYDTVGQLVQRCGIELQHQNFHAHFTLARFKNLKGTGAFVQTARQYQTNKLGDFLVEEVHLMESKLSSGSPVYVSLGNGQLA